MKRHLLIATAAALLFTPSAFAVEDNSAAGADDAKPEAVQVEPGEGPTEAVTEEVPEMKGGAQEEHPPTEEVGEEVPPMKPDDDEKAKGQTSDDAE